VVNKGEMVEQGTFPELMEKKGLMAKLVSESVQIVDDNKEEISHLHLKRHSTDKHSFSSQLANLQSRRSSKTDENLTKDQILNREHLLRKNRIEDTEENLAALIESNQMLGEFHRSGDDHLLKAIQRARLSVVSIADSIGGEIVPTDSEPMRLVLEDQSVNYKISPMMTYLRAGSGIVITLLVYAFFFIVYVFRILTGNKIFVLYNI
jgi:hypothetical protein